ncbi:MAG: alpha/beta fold hydrolase [Synergistaceae bacterium]|nr:alpha/beta fold hydrolase [Synergistaceae bacterium]
MKKTIFALMLAVLFAVSAHGETIPVQIDGSVGKLSAVIQKPELKDGGKCPLVMILHGFTGTKGEKLLTTFADALEAAGIASIRFDFNGHGESEGAFVNMTVLNEIEDARHVYEYVRDLRYVSEVSIAGHSQGGVVASMLAGELGTESFRKVILFAAAAVLRDDAIRGNVMGAAYDAGNPPESVKIFGRYDLGRDYMLTAQTLPIYETAERFTGPVCLIHGKADRIVPYTYSERYHKNYAVSELHLIDRADHGLTGFENTAAKIAVDFLKK